MWTRQLGQHCNTGAEKIHQLYPGEPDQRKSIRRQINLFIYNRSFKIGAFRIETDTSPAGVQLEKNKHVNRDWVIHQA